MANDFEEIMGKQTNAALIKILKSEPGDYQPAALEAAQNEFNHRNLSEEKITAVKQAIEQEKQLEENKANESLGIGWKILTFIIPAIFTLILGGTLKADGYTRKYKELVRWTLYGFGFYVGLFVLMAVLAQF
ncbi:MAG TPA: hypothetical protein VK668_14540 [Mucilaginibacter sp.]|nr:hypothetical protein [Mucilaginibacter sp.]